MHERGKSDRPVVPAKAPNNAGRPAAEVPEERGLAKGNTDRPTRRKRSAGPGVPSGLDRVREVARGDKNARFTALLHHVTVARLRTAYRAIRPQAAPGVDGVTWQAYGQDLEANLQDLHHRVHSGGACIARMPLASPSAPPAPATSASHGIVLVNEDDCIGCGLCAWACPYGAREMDQAAGIMKKCTLCVDRIDNPNLPEIDRIPACVRTCPPGARHFGDLADPDSAVSKLVAERGGIDLMPEQKTRPVNKYLPPRDRDIDVLAPFLDPIPEAQGGFLGWLDRALARL